MRVLLVGLLLLFISANATTSRADDANDCMNGQDDIQIRGCSRIIKSRKLFGKAISKSNLASAYYNRGVAYDDKGEFDRTIADYTKAIALNPKHVNAYDNRGIAYRNKGEFDRAITDHTKAIKLNPKHANAYTNRGVAYDDKGDRKQAIVHFRKALEIDPSHQVAKNNLKRLGVTP